MGISSTLHYACRYCTKSYASRQSRWNHEQRCTIRIQFAEQSETESTCSSIMPRSHTDKKHASASEALILERLHKLEELVSKSQDNNKQQNTSPTSNITVTNNTFQPTVIINQFGMEDISYIPSDILTRMVRQMDKGVVELAKVKHFHERHPENHNIRRLSLKQRMAQVNMGASWCYLDLDDLLERLFSRNYDVLDAHFLENEQELKAKFGNSFRIVEAWFDKARNCDKDTLKTCKRKIMIMLMNMMDPSKRLTAN